MGIIPRKISWVEPFDWKVSKERIRQGYRELYKYWLFFLILFAVLVAGAAYTKISKHIKAQESLTWELIVSATAIPFLGYGVLFLCLPCLYYVFPYGIHVTEKGVGFQAGNSARMINAMDIISLSFETRNGRRCFVVKARDKKGLPYERLALMAKKNATEEDVRRFLYDVNLAHLFVASSKDMPGAQTAYETAPSDIHTATSSPS